MIQLSEENFEFLIQYSETLNIIEEGFDYVLASFNDLTLKNSDLVIGDILVALTSIANSNVIAKKLFEKDSTLSQLITEFHTVSESTFLLEGQFNEINAQLDIITHQIYPRFISWKKKIQNEFRKHIQQ